MKRFTEHNRVSPRRKNMHSAPQVRDFILQIRRTRRLLRPHLPLLTRALISVFTAFVLRENAHFAMGDTWHFIMSTSVMLASMASVLSLVFFDIKFFNLVLIGSVLVCFFGDLCHYQQFSVVQLLAGTMFQITALSFSSLVGRRKSLNKPGHQRQRIRSSGEVLEIFKDIEKTDLVEAGIRMQTTLLVLDYALSEKLGRTLFLFTLPFALLFLAGYCTQRNGTVVIVLLIVFSVVTESSLVLGFNFPQTVCTASGAILALSVGPGMLTTDEWMASKEDLYF